MVKEKISFSTLLVWAICIFLNIPLNSQDLDPASFYNKAEEKIIKDLEDFEKNKGEITSLVIRSGALSLPSWVGGGYEINRQKVIAKYKNRQNGRMRETERRRNKHGVIITFKRIKSRSDNTRYRLRYENGELIFLERKDGFRTTRMASGKYIMVTLNPWTKLNAVIITPHVNNLREEDFSLFEP